MQIQMKSGSLDTLEHLFRFKRLSAFCSKIKSIRYQLIHLNHRYHSGSSKSGRSIEKKSKATRINLTWQTCWRRCDHHRWSCRAETPRDSYHSSPPRTSPASCHRNEDYGTSRWRYYTVDAPLPPLVFKKIKPTYCSIDCWGSGAGIESAIFHNDPEALQDHCLILKQSQGREGDLPWGKKNLIFFFFTSLITYCIMKMYVN